MMSDYSLEGQCIRFEARPRFEGCNVGTWIGFKHIFYLAEEGALHYMREGGMGASLLLKDHALGLEVVDTRLRLLRPVEADDSVTIEVRNLTKSESRELTFGISLFPSGPGTRPPIASGRVKLALRKTGGQGADVKPPPDALRRFVVDRIERSAAVDAPPPPRTLDEVDSKNGRPSSTAASRRQFAWAFRIPYYYCHYTERLQHSGYVRLMEETIDRFLADRGISIATLLSERQWIPVVASAQVEMLAEAKMEETLWSVLDITDIAKDTTFTARIDHYVEREGKLVPAATGSIVHAYLHIRDRGVGSAIVTFDQRVKAALSSAMRDAP